MLYSVDPVAHVAYTSATLCDLPTGTVLLTIDDSRSLPSLRPHRPSEQPITARAVRCTRLCLPKISLIFEPILYCTRMRSSCSIPSIYPKYSDLQLATPLIDTDRGYGFGSGLRATRSFSHLDVIGGRSKHRSILEVGIGNVH